MDVGSVLLGAAALVTAVSAPYGYWLGRRKRNAEADSITAGVAEQVRGAFSASMDDLAAMCEAATKDAASARASAREAQTRAAEAENNAWAAKMSASSMERFLLTLRPLIITYIPDHEQLLDQLDRLAPARTG